MKYFIAHLLQGDVAEYHTNLTKILSERYHTTALHKKVQSHLTVKIPFEANSYELAQVENRLELFASKAHAVPLTFERFGRFGFKTVYLDVVKSNLAVELVRSCVSDMNAFPWMQRVTHEGNKLHASVARFMTYKQFRRVWRHVKNEPAYFKTTLGSLALLKKETPHVPWVLHREFEFATLPSPKAYFQEASHFSTAPH